MADTKIEWAEKVWNPVTGCSKISEGCKNCYAERFSKRMKGRYGYPKENPFQVTFHPSRLEEPYRWKKPSRIFVCSMGDLFHEKVSYDWIEKVWDTMFDWGQHTFLILTKRPGRVQDFSRKMNDVLFRAIDYPNIWLGVSVENQETADERIPVLLDIPMKHRFVSVEPMLESVQLFKYLQRLDWIICGGETGPGARLMNPYWVFDLKRDCQYHNVPFFFKQWNKKGDRLINGKEYNEFPKE